MTEEFLINFTPQETRAVLMQQGVVQELHVERTASRGIVGNVYLGTVVRVLPGMQSAFIDIGLERTAFLHVADIWSERHNGEHAQPIERILNEGQRIIVQVLKDPIGSKGARLSTQISIAGRLLVFLPQEHHIGISQRIEDEAGREAPGDPLALRDDLRLVRDLLNGPPDRDRLRYAGQLLASIGRAMRDSRLAEAAQTAADSGDRPSLIALTDRPLHKGALL